MDHVTVDTCVKNVNICMKTVTDIDLLKSVDLQSYNGQAPTAMNFNHFHNTDPNTISNYHQHYYLNIVSKLIYRLLCSSRRQFAILFRF